jgi:hypothetical protein
MADDVQLTVGADVGDAVAGLGELRQAIAAATQPVLRLKTAFADAGTAAGRIAQPFRRAFAEIGASWQSALKAYITAPSGAAGWRQRMGALHGLYSSEIGAGLGLGEAVLSKGSAALLGATGGQGLGNFLGGKLFGMLGLGGGAQSSKVALDTLRNTLLTQIYAAQQITNSLLGTIAGSSSTTAAATASAAATGPAASVAGGGIGGIFSGIGKFLGFAEGGIVPSAAGGWALPSFPGAQPALLHAREMVLPAPISEGIQRAIAGGGFGQGGESAGGDLHVHFHGPADGPAVERWFRGLLARSPNVIRDMLRSNALTPRSL